MTNKKAGILYSIVALCFLVTMILETVKDGFSVWSALHIVLVLGFGYLAISSFKTGDRPTSSKRKK